ncbi:DUF6284 family protein [Streptomyces sp. NPDC001034]|uniref:DUF6284 family protein n=1 Tax=Streptomyces sp. NPDC001034 TaxID=3154375 RepID=UPI00332E06F3
MSNGTEQGQSFDSDRFVLLHTIYNARLVRYLRARMSTGEWMHAEEVAHTVWATAAARLHTLRESDDKAFGWLCEIGRHAVAAYYLRERGRRKAALDARLAGLDRAPSKLDERRIRRARNKVLIERAALANRATSGEAA